MNYDNIKDMIRTDVEDTIGKLRGILMTDNADLLAYIGDFTDDQYAEVRNYLEGFADQYSAGTTLASLDGYVSLMPHYDSNGIVDGILNMNFVSSNVFEMDANLAVSISSWFRMKYTLTSFLQLCEDLGIEGEQNLWTSVYQLDDIEDYDGSGSDQEIVYNDLYNDYFISNSEFVANFVVGYDSESWLIKINNQNQKIEIQNPRVTSFTGDATTIQLVLGSLANSLQIQQMMSMFLDVAESPNASIDKLSIMLNSSVGTYTDAASNGLRQFLSGIDQDGPRGILNGVMAMYYNLSHTTVDEEGHIEFYSDDYVTKMCWSSVTDALVTTIPMLVSTFLTVINPIVGMIVYGVSQLGILIYNTMHAKVTINIDDKAVNSCIGYPLFQRFIAHNDPDITKVPFYTLVKQHNIIVANTPIIKYTVWMDADENIYVECFLNVDYRASDLRTLLRSMGFRLDAVGTNTPYDLNTDKTVTYTSSSLWRKLNELSFPGAFTLNDDNDQLAVVKYCFALAFLLGNNLSANVDRIYSYGETQFVGKFATDLSSSHYVTVGESLGSIVTNSIITSWQDLGFFVRNYINKDIDSSVFGSDLEYLNYAYNHSYTYDIPSQYLLLLDNWYKSADQDFIAGVGSPMTITYGMFWDRDHMYVKPPEWTASSVWAAIIISTITIAAVTAAAIAFKVAVKKKLGQRYNAITAQYSEAQDAYKAGDIERGNEIIKQAQKSTKRYNVLARLLGASTLSYTTGWENGDVSPTTGLESLSETAKQAYEDSSIAGDTDLSLWINRVGKLITPSF